MLEIDLQELRHGETTVTQAMIDNGTLDALLAQWYKTGERVEVTWKEGYEEYIGYGCKTEGCKGRFYIGKSTGTQPIWLQIDNRRSLGGPALMIFGIQTIRPLGTYRR